MQNGEREDRSSKKLHGNDADLDQKSDISLLLAQKTQEIETLVSENIDLTELVQSLKQKL